MKQDVEDATKMMGVERMMIGEDRLDLTLYKKRKITLFGPVEGCVVNGLIKKFLSFPPYSTKNVECWIKSPGGSVDDGFSLIDVMMSRKYSISTIGVGSVSSMAVLILAVGTKGCRYISSNTDIMVHQIKWGAEGSVDEMKSRGKQSLYLQNKYSSLLASVTNKKKKFWEDMMKTEETWITAKDAVKYGLVDHIGLP